MKLIKEKYYVLVEKDDFPEIRNSQDGYVEVAITNARKNAPFMISTGKGHGFMGGPISVESIRIGRFQEYFSKYNLEWVVLFIENNPNFTEEQLKKEILKHGIPLIVRYY